MKNYRLNCGQYVLHEDDKPIGRALDELAMAFDRDAGILHKHGPIDLVSAWLTDAQKKYRAAGFDAMAETLVMVSGRFPVDEINRCISNTTYADHFYAKLMAGGIQQEPWPGLSEKPKTSPLTAPSAPAVDESPSPDF